MRFRAKPLLVKAIQHDGSEASLDRIRKLANRTARFEAGIVTLRTVHGDAMALPTDWVIRDSSGGISVQADKAFQRNFAPAA